MKTITIEAHDYVSDLGTVLIATVGRNILSVTLGNNSYSLWDDFKARFLDKKSNVSVTWPGNPDLHEHILDVVEGIIPSRFSWDRFSLKGTDFQKSVLKEVYYIPRGTTITYKELSNRVTGSPNSARAVANACGANPIAILIPCHRVVGSNGTLGGYRWGKYLKAELLDSEKLGVKHE